jgi:hypothetical protein
MPDATRILDTAASRGDSAYLAIAAMILCGLIMSGMGYLQIKLWREIREDMKIDRSSSRKAMEVVSITNLGIQQTLSVLGLTVSQEGPNTPEECRDYHKRADAIFQIQADQKKMLEKMTT